MNYSADMFRDVKVLFREVQRSRQWWLFAVILLTCAVTVCVFGYLVVMQLLLHRPVGDHPMSNAALAANALFVLGVNALIVWSFIASNLVTEVRPDGLYIRYFPFHRKFRKIPLENSVSVEAVTYSPIADYGGWGLRYGKKGRAYNPCGNRGVRISYNNGRHILIGSQRPEELVEAVGRVNC